MVVEGVGGENMIVWKGEVEEMMEIWKKVREGEKVRDIEEVKREKIIEKESEYNEEGLRVIVVDKREIKGDEKSEK